MSFPRYPNYKPSGVEWLGEVPGHWGVKRLKRICSVFPSNIDKKSYDNEEPIKLCNYTDVYYSERITADMDFMPATASSEQVKKFTLQSGDVIFTKDSETTDDIAIATYVTETIPGVVCGYHLSIARPFHNTHGNFIKRVFDSKYLKAKFAVLANGLTRMGLSQYAVDNVDIPVPPPAEQTTIAAFLDRETAKIDALVAEQQRLIELLAEKRQAVISHAVTKGLDPAAPMKDSGVEWLGEVPGHWGFMPLKHAGNIISGAAFKSSDFSSSGIRVLKIANIQTMRLDWSDDSYVPEELFEKYSPFAVKDGDVVFALTRPIISSGLKAAIADIGEELVLLNQRNALFRPNHLLNRGFLYYLLFSVSFITDFEISIDVTGQQPNVSPVDIGDIRVALPPIEEQIIIECFLDNEITKITDLTTEAHRAIALLKERRAALISAAVTGKIDVRGLAGEAA